MEWEKHGVHTIHSQRQQMEANGQHGDDAKLGNGAENFERDQAKFWAGIDEGSHQIAEDCANCLRILINYFIYVDAKKMNFIEIWLPLVKFESSLIFIDFSLVLINRMIQVIYH